VIYEWDIRKAAENLRRHDVSFEEAQTVFLDPLAERFDDPDHSDDQRRFITLGMSTSQRLLFVPMPTPARIASGLSARGQLRAVRPMPTKNEAGKTVDELRPEYDLSKLKGGVRGKYYERASAGTTFVLLEPDVAEAFPDGRTVNQALRALIKVAESRVRTTRGETANGPLQPTSRAKRKAKSTQRSRAARG
jgi:uncharacterized DUF497 family protein